MLKKFNSWLGIAGLLCLTVIAKGQVVSDTPVKGTPYMQEAYVDGVIYYASKNLTAPIRYNAYQDLIEYKQDGKALVLDANSKIQKVQLGDEAFVPQKYNLNGKSKLGYFALLDSGKVMLFAKRKIVFSPVQKGRALDGVGDMPAEFKRTADEFYYRIGDGELQELSNIKSMIATFPDKQSEVTQYAKKEKISPKKEKEVIMLVQYYNSL
ncbi:MAG: hypothetical protein WKF87_00275 [Chryseolinea sp.]